MQTQELLNQEKNHQITFIIDTLKKVKILSNENVWASLILSSNPGDHPEIDNVMAFANTLLHPATTWLDQPKPCSEMTISIIKELWQKRDSSCHENEQLSAAIDELTNHLSHTEHDIKILIECLQPLNASYDELAKRFNFTKFLNVVYQTSFNLDAFEQLSKIIQPLMADEFPSDEILSTIDKAPKSDKLKALQTSICSDDIANAPTLNKLKAALTSICQDDGVDETKKCHELTVCILSSLNEQKLLRPDLANLCEQALHAFANINITNFPKIAGALLNIALISPLKTSCDFKESLERKLHKLQEIVAMSQPNKPAESCSYAASCSATMYSETSIPKKIMLEFREKINTTLLQHDEEPTANSNYQLK